MFPHFRYLVLKPQDVVWRVKLRKSHWMKNPVLTNTCKLQKAKYAFDVHGVGRECFHCVSLCADQERLSYIDFKFHTLSFSTRLCSHFLFFSLFTLPFPSFLCFSPSCSLFFKNCRNFLFLSCHLVSLHSGFPARSLPLELCSRYMPFQAHKFSRSSCYNSGFCLENAISKSIRMIVVWIQGI